MLTRSQEETADFLFVFLFVFFPLQDVPYILEKSMSFLWERSQLHVPRVKQGKERPERGFLAGLFFFLFCIVLNRISFEGNLVQDRICRALQKGNLALFQLLCLSCGLSAWPGSSQALPPQCQHGARSADFSGGDDFPFPWWHVCSMEQPLG